MSTIRHHLPAIILFFAVLIIWELGVRAFDVQRFLLPAPSVIGRAFIDNFDRLMHIGWFTTKRMFRFTEECMSMKEGKGERNLKPATRSNPPLDLLAVRPAAAIKTLKPAVDCPLEMVNGGKLIAKSRVTVTINKTDDGRTVSVVMKGIGSGEFKGDSGVRARLESIPGIKWSFPKNDSANGVRTMEGVITPAAVNDKVAAGLIEAANRIG